MNGLKKCKQCGTIKSENLFREYYGRGAQKGTRTGNRYKTCKDCETVNSRLKYLLKKDILTESEQLDVDNIYELYTLLRAAGLRPPTDEKKEKPVATLITDMIAAASSIQPVVKVVLDDGEVPDELQTWLTKSFEGQDPEAIEEELEDLEDKYRPLVISHGSQIPVRDHKYESIFIDLDRKLEDYKAVYYANKD
jgi:hypothetical protein